jgi:uncharacterized protein YegJ (DUF2314 family)
MYLYEKIAQQAVATLNAYADLTSCDDGKSNSFQKVYNKEKEKLLALTSRLKTNNFSFFLSPDNTFMGARMWFNAVAFRQGMFETVEVITLIVTLNLVGLSVTSNNQDTPYCEPLRQLLMQVVD